MDLGLTLAPESQQRHGTSDTPLDDDPTFWDPFHDIFDDPSNSADVQDFAALIASNDQQPDLQTADNGYHVAYSMIQPDTAQGQKRTVEETGFELEQGTDSASAGSPKKPCIEHQAPAGNDDAHAQASQPLDLPGVGYFTAPSVSSGPASEVDILQNVPALPQAASALTTHETTGNGVQVRAASCGVSAKFIRNVTDGRRRSDATSEPCKSHERPISAPLSLPGIFSQNHGLPTPASSGRRSSAGGNSTDEKEEARIDREASTDSLFDEVEVDVDMTGEESAVRITNETVPDTHAIPRNTPVDETNTFPNARPQVALAATTISLPKAPPEFPVSVPYPAPRASTALVQNHAIQSQDVVASQSREMLHAVAPPVRHISPYPRHGGPLDYFPSANNLHTRNTEISHNHLVSRLDETEKRNSKLTYERTKLIASFRENIELDPATGKTTVQLLREEIATMKKNRGTLEAQLADSRQRTGSLEAQLADSQHQVAESRQRHDGLLNHFHGLESAHIALINQCHFLGFYKHIHAMNQSQGAPTPQQNAPRAPMPTNNSPAVYPQRSAAVATVHQAQAPDGTLVSPVSNQMSPVAPPPMHTPAGYPVGPTTSGSVLQHGISIMPRPRSATSAFPQPAQQQGHHSATATGRPVPQSTNHPGPSAHTPRPQTPAGTPMVPYTSQGQVRTTHPNVSGPLPQQIHAPTPVRPIALGHTNAASSVTQFPAQALHSAATRPPQQQMYAPIPMGPHSSGPVNPARSQTSPIPAQVAQPVASQPQQQVQAQFSVGPNAIGPANRAGTPIYPAPAQTVQPVPAPAPARPAVSYASPVPVQAMRPVAAVHPHNQVQAPTPMMSNPGGPVNPIGTQTFPVPGQVALSVEHPSNQQQAFPGPVDPASSGATNQATIDLTADEDSAGARQATSQSATPNEDRAQEFYKVVRRKDYNWLGNQNHMQQGFQYKPPTHPTVAKSQKSRSRPNSRGKTTATTRSSPAKPRGASRPTSRGNATAAARSPSPVQNGQSVEGTKESSDAQELTPEDVDFAQMMEDELMAS